MHVGCQKIARLLPSMGKYVNAITGFVPFKSSFQIVRPSFRDGTTIEKFRAK